MRTIQLRVDEHVKQQAKEIFEQMGLDMSTAVKIYLQQVILRKEIPFRIMTENGLTREEETEINKAAKEAMRGENIDATVHTHEELQEYLDSLKA